MKWIREHTHVVDHPRLLEAGAIGRDLWHWGMLFAGKHETDGVLPMSAVLATPWGAGGKKNVMVAQKLVAVGLWDRVDVGYQICRWSEMGNPTKAELEDKRKEEREGRKGRRQRSSMPPAGDLENTDVSAPDNAGCPPRTPQGVPYSLSSGLTDRIESTDHPRPASAPEWSADPQKPPPDWWDSVCETVQFETGVDIPRGEAWLRYAGHRGDKRRPPERGHAVYWLTTVVVKEAREARDNARRQADRDAKFDRARGGPPEPVRETPEQSAKFAAELAARVAARKARERGAA
jgi:hypothetical protein